MGDARRRKQAFADRGEPEPTPQVLLKQAIQAFHDDYLRFLRTMKLAVMSRQERGNGFLQVGQGCYRSSYVYLWMGRQKGSKKILY